MGHSMRVTGWCAFNTSAGIFAEKPEFGLSCDLGDLRCSELIKVRVNYLSRTGGAWPAYEPGSAGGCLVVFTWDTVRFLA